MACRSQIKLFRALVLASALLWASSGASLAQAAKPIVNDPMPQQKTLEVGASTTISVTAADPDNDPLQYSWSAVSGTITGTGRTINYETPKLIPIAGVDTITVTVSDGENVVSKSTTIRIEAPASPTKLYFSPNSGNIKIGDTAKEVKVLLDSGPINVGQVDLVITYNSTVLELQDENPSQPGAQIAASNSAKALLRNEVQPTSSSVNQIVFSATYPDLKGEGLHVATLHFKALKEQTRVPVQFQFLKFSPSDTNVIKTGTVGVDTLQEIGDAEFNLVPGGSALLVQTPGVIAGNLPSFPPTATTPAAQPALAQPAAATTPALADSGPSDTILGGIAIFLFAIYFLLKICVPKRS